MDPTFLGQLTAAALNLLPILLRITVGLLILKGPGRFRWLTLLGSIVVALADGAVQTMTLFPNLMNDGESSGYFTRVIRLIRISTFGEILFLSGLLLFVLRSRTRFTRIAELEQILAAQNSRLQ